MYRLLAILLLFNFALGHFHFDSDEDDYDECDDSGPSPYEHHHGPRSWRHHHGAGRRYPWQKQPEESDFDKLARYVISADKEVMNSCKKSPYSRVRVLPGADVYALKYSLPEFNESGIRVQIKHRVISTTAQALGVASFTDLRIIPDVVKAANASCVFNKGTLTVSMPYKNPLEAEVALGCTGYIDESVISVFKTPPSKTVLSFDFLKNRRFF